MTHVVSQELVERYLGLESFEVTEELLDLCGTTIDVRALPLLKRRLIEEEAKVLSFEGKGYVRMREKSEQMVASLKVLITVLEERNDDTSIQSAGTEHRGITQ